jgi:hypothetical protein
VSVAETAAVMLESPSKVSVSPLEIGWVVEEPLSTIVKPEYVLAFNSLMAPTTLEAVVVSVATSPISVEERLLKVVLNVSSVSDVNTVLAAIIF